ncbi:EAL domain-containing response regulator [Bordetella genomosp. 9]|uniref:Diguanylate phosphodiesterase n=1 Tax=Bordetella genomosp. 9 TaxID=1416803 RepID=A0A1W6YVJ3_9BORD|nr:EAL domain-containing protein [Bordetella genomosp. 9]ARP85107.1 diguanylate phosphodiesterase [Bordetella genomosp. 9]
MPLRYANLRVLVVEDHPFQRLAAEALLHELGVRTVISAEGGVLAADILSSASFDVVLCDIQMPEGNGPELIAELHRRGQDAFVGIPPTWIWMSALAADILESHRALARAAGIARVHALRKPLSTEAVEEILSSTLTKQPTGETTAPWVPDDAELLDAVQSAAGLTLMLQPQYELATGRLAGAEALVRWRHPEHGLVRPDVFIPRLETMDAADPVFFFVTRQCLAAQQRLRAASIDIKLGINASAQTLCRPGVLEQFDAMVAGSGLPPSVLAIELTEGYPVNNPLALSVTMNRLRLMGYGVAIDDFGIGIATLKLLADLPFTQMKLDRSFVSDVNGDNQRAAICRNMIALARDLGIECVAEGIETDPQRVALRALQCRFGQGYLWSAPKPVEAFVADAMEEQERSNLSPGSASVS